jgi:hypothetical protein
MRAAIAALSLLMVSGVANAQPRAVLSGATINIYNNAAVNPDCSSAGQIVLRITQPPEHGRVSVKNTRVFPYFPPFNPRSVCNHTRVPGVQLFYISQRGYFGSDSLSFEMFGPNGQSRQFNYDISVR